MKKRLFQLFLLAIGLMGTMFASGCEELCDGSPDEPVFEIFYNAGGTVTKVYAVKDGVNLPPIEGAIGAIFDLPVDTNGSSVTYTFETTQGNKSMQVFYDISANLESFDCGFRFLIENPTVGSTDFDTANITKDIDNYQITIQ